MSEPKVKKYPKTFNLYLNRYSISGCPQGSPSSSLYQSVNSFIDWQNEISLGPNIPDWRQAIQGGRSATTNLSFSGYEVFGKPGSMSFLPCPSCTVQPRGLPSGFHSQFGYFETAFNLTNATGFIGSANLSDADNKAKTQFISKARKAQRSILSGELLKDLRKTIQTIKRPADGAMKLIRSYLGDLKKGPPRSRRLNLTSSARSSERRKYLADQWLSTNFGLRPLISDIDSGIKAYIDREKRLAGQRVSGRGFSEDSAITHYDRTFSNQANYYSFDQIRVCRYKVTYAAFVKGHISATNAVLSESGISMQDFVPTAWEVLPWSFLVDYFSNIGNILSAWSYNSSNLAWVQKTTVFETFSTFENVKRDMVNFDIAAGIYKLCAPVFVPFELTLSRKTITRTPYNGSLVPDFRLYLPSRPDQFLNMAALAASYRRKVEPYY